MDIKGQERLEEVIKMTRQIIYDEHGEKIKTYEPGVLMSLQYELEIEETLKTPTAAAEFSKNIIMELSHAVGIPENRLSILCYQRHDDDCKLARVVFHDWHVEEDTKNLKSLETIAQELHTQAQNENSPLRKGKYGKKLQRVVSSGHITKHLHDYVCNHTSRPKTSPWRSCLLLSVTFGVLAGFAAVLILPATPRVLPLIY